MSDDELHRYFSAIQTLKQDGELDRFARTHMQAMVTGGAHSGPAFLPWHREFIKRFEFAVRQVDPTLALPYWDSTLDEALDRPIDSVLFSVETRGGADAQRFVNTGLFLQWGTSERRPSERELGAKGGLVKQSEIDFIMKQSEIDQVLAFSAPKKGCPYKTDYSGLEYIHGNVSFFVDGDAFDTSTLANDPLLFHHYAFIDSIWENWRQHWQNRTEREVDYPPDNELCSNAQHFAGARMHPFSPFRNIHGLSNNYTDNLYEYAPRPTCTQTQPDCGSKYLFCDQSHGQPRCSAKVRSGAACNGYLEGENPCFDGVCVMGRCTTSNEERTTNNPALSNRNDSVTAVSQETCFNEFECCTVWAKRGECIANAIYMNIHCKASCGLCEPQYQLRDDCSDRHESCQLWAERGHCATNRFWMAENCRNSCSKCDRTRAQSCREDGGALLARRDDGDLEVKEYRMLLRNLGLYVRKQTIATTRTFVVRIGVYLVNARSCNNGCSVTVVCHVDIAYHRPTLMDLVPTTIKSVVDGLELENVLKIRGCWRTVDLRADRAIHCGISEKCVVEQMGVSFLARLLHKCRFLVCKLLFYRLLQTPFLQIPGLQIPFLQTPGLQTPGLQTPGLLSPPNLQTSTRPLGRSFISWQQGSWGQIGVDNDAWRGVLTGWGSGGSGPDPWATVPMQPPLPTAVMVPSGLGRNRRTRHK
ncbi:hypothetical protein KIN20_022883 [Parelaphostrongylus tenuis]|uniref:ShKT domain-containing protein n=1 Tax=Parelaphostrongylus tenuis TaxID=148309 RepID=A0AAD5QX24_PARTN|nr:hypothetical protein KIN20_022883 [Parelaphostrongylus tenuis]